MNSLLKKVLTSVGGLALVLGFWTIQGKIFGSSEKTIDKIPAKVWEGGGTTLVIETDSNNSAVVRALFESTSKTNGTPVRSLGTYEKIAPGHHTWTVDVPATVGGDLEFQAEDPKPGARLTWTVRTGDKVLKQESETLDTALHANEAFFLKLDSEDFSVAEADE